MSLLDRIAGAPDSWGIDETPGWGHRMDRDRVLAEMREIGLKATELGPDGYLPTDVTELQELLDRHDLALVGGFVPVVLYREDRIEESLDYVDRCSAQLAGAGADVMVLGPDSHHEGYNISVELTEDEWTLFSENLNRVVEIATEHGLTPALHQHWAMAVERQDHVERILATSDMPLCIDTGHLVVAGADPVAIARMAPDRVTHVHLKDVEPNLAERVRVGDLTFEEGVREGLFLPLGRGCVDLRGLIEILEANGYEGWYVLEQDRVVDEEPAPGAGPILDARTSVEALRALAAEM
jgi:inosose dehydratase